MFPKRQKITSSSFKHHPGSVLAGVTDEGLANVSLKSSTAVNYVVSHENMMKVFGLAEDQNSVSELVAGHVTAEDVAVDGDAVVSDAYLQKLQQEVAMLEKSEVSFPKEEFAYMESIKSLAKEFVWKEDEAEEEMMVYDELKRRNDQLRGEFEKSTGSKVVLGMVEGHLRVLS